MPGAKVPLFEKSSSMSFTFDMTGMDRFSAAFKLFAAKSKPGIIKKKPALADFPSDSSGKHKTVSPKSHR